MSSSSVENSPENIEKELQLPDDILNKPKENEHLMMVPLENDQTIDRTEKSRQKFVIPQIGKSKKCYNHTGLEWEK